MPNRFLIDRLNHSAKVPCLHSAGLRTDSDRPRTQRQQNGTGGTKKNADSRDRTSDLQIFSLTLSQLSYTGDCWDAGLVGYAYFCLAGEKKIQKGP